MDFVKKTPEDLIKDHGWVERNEAKDEEEKKVIRARLQELSGEIATAQAQKSGKEGLLAEAEEKERNTRTGIEKLTSVMTLHARAKQLEGSIEEQSEAEAGYADRIDTLARISDEIKTNNVVVQEQDALLAKGLEDINNELNRAAQSFLGENSFASLEMPRGNLSFTLRDHNGGGGKTYGSVIRPLILDWLAVSYGAAGKSPHHAFFIQDSPFQGEMQADLQLAYLKMILSLSTDWQKAYQQIVLTSSSGADSIDATHANIIKLTPDLSGRLLPGVELSRQGFEQMESANEGADL